MYTKSLALAALAASPAFAQYSVNIYWGQNTGTPLKTVCQNDGFEYLTLGFLNESPENDPSGQGYPGSNYAGNCGATTYGGSDLQSACGAITGGIATCQANGKKVLLSIGGVFGDDSDYTVSSPAEGEKFADFLWSAYGPLADGYTGPRPFADTVVDGFDFDLEKKFTDQSGYIALVNRLRQHISDAGSSAIITAAPQCPLASEWFDMESLITQSKFDALFIQFYNNPSCDYVTGNNNGQAEAFNFNDWQTFIATTASAGAKLYVGLPGDASTSSAGSGYVTPDAAAQLVKDLKAQPSFAGAMVWDANTGGSNVLANGRNYYQNLHDALAITAVPTTGCSTYTVKSGDGCFTIGEKYGLTVAELEALNPGVGCEPPAYIYVGEVLVVAGTCPVTSTTSTTSSATSTTSSSSTETTSSVATTTESSTSTTETSTTETSTSASETSTSTSETSTSETSTSTSETSTSETSTSETSTSTSASETSTETETSTSTSISTSTDVGTSTSTSSTTSTTTDVSTTTEAPVTSGNSTSTSTSAPFGNGTTTADPSTSTSATFSNGTTTADPTSSTSLVDPTFTLPPFSNSTTTTGGVPSQTGLPTGTGSSPSSSSSSVLPTITSAPTNTGGNGSGSGPTITDSPTLTTSTLTTTTVYTITSCPATVPNCPVGHVTTETIILGTTVCPVGAPATTTTTTPAPGVNNGAAAGGDSGEWTTSTVYTTTIRTITACPASVPNCPERGSVTTETVAAYTTICPVAAANPTKPAAGGVPAGSVPAGGVGGGVKEQAPTTTTSVTTVAYTFVTVPSKPATTAPAGGIAGPSAGTYTVKPTGAASLTGAVPVGPTGTGKPVTAGAGRNGAAVVGVIAAAAAVFLL